MKTYVVRLVEDKKLLFNIKDNELIGELPDTAVWVRDGHEFERREVRIFKRVSVYSSKILTNAMGKPWQHKEDRIITPGTVTKIEVKCPCCETYK